MKVSRFFVPARLVWGIALLFGMTLLGSGAALSSWKFQQRRHGVLIIGGSSQSKIVDGRGRYILVSGRANYVQIRGQASTVRVTGNDNHVRVSTVRQIEVTGRDNHVLYNQGPGGSTPRIFQRAGNDVSRGR